LVESGMGVHSGAYAGVIHGMEGQKISIQVGKTTHHLTLQSQDRYQVHFMKSLFGEKYAPLQKGMNSIALSSLLLIATISLGLVMYRRARKKQE
jgi:hypothetical protein